MVNEPKKHIYWVTTRLMRLFNLLFILLKLLLVRITNLVQRKLIYHFTNSFVRIGVFFFFKWLPYSNNYLKKIRSHLKWTELLDFNLYPKVTHMYKYTDDKIKQYLVYSFGRLVKLFINIIISQFQFLNIF